MFLSVGAVDNNLLTYLLGTQAAAANHNGSQINSALTMYYVPRISENAAGDIFSCQSSMTLNLVNNSECKSQSTLYFSSVTFVIKMYVLLYCLLSAQETT